jgi:hypothetical protein
MVRGPNKRGGGITKSARGRGGSGIPLGGVHSTPAGRGRAGEGTVAGRGGAGRVVGRGDSVRRGAGRGGTGPQTNSFQARSGIPGPAEESAEVVPTARSEYSSLLVADTEK